MVAQALGIVSPGAASPRPGLHRAVQPVERGREHEPRLQGVDGLGDYSVTIRAKMMTLPGEQFVIRCQAYAMIKKASTRTASNSRSRPCRSSAKANPRSLPSQARIG